MSTAADIIALADAVAAALNAQFAAELTATRKCAPVLAVDQLTDLQAAVVPRSTEPVRLARASTAWQAEIVIEIGLQQKCGDDEETTAGEVIDAAQRVLEYLRVTDMALGSGVTAMPVGAKNDPVISPEHLRQYRVATSVVQVTYKV